MTVYVVASVIPAGRQHASFGVVRGVFETPEAADAWMQAANTSRAFKNNPCAVFPAPLSPELPAPADDVVISAPCADATGVPA